jgi:hypothetical protein
MGFCTLGLHGTGSMELSATGGQKTKWWHSLQPGLVSSIMSELVTIKSLPGPRGARAGTTLLSSF